MDKIEWKFIQFYYQEQSGMTSFAPARANLPEPSGKSRYE